MSRPANAPGVFRGVRCPDTASAYANRLVFNRADFADGSYVRIESRHRRDGQGAKICTVLIDPQGRVPPGHVGIALPMRGWLGAAENDDHEVYPFDPRTLGDYLATSATFTLKYFGEKPEATPRGGPIDSEQLEVFFRQRFNGLMLTVGMVLVFEYQQVVIMAVVKELRALDLVTTSNKSVSSAAFNPESEATFVKDSATRLQIKASSKRGPANAIINPDFKFGDMGIGGLDAEFSNIFRRAFASRIFPPGLVDKLGIQHVKGILLFGPPGTGKTLMARQIGKMLNAREPKIVNGPEILNKFVGQSEENIRKLFADAEKEYKQRGDDSGLHIIIFDELDAICKQRGSTGGGTGVGDSVVNQLLSKMDGVDQLNNILIIGMTNRLDMIDEALLRPGRLEVHMEISLPDKHGRLQILNIHTKKMRDNRILAGDVDLGELSERTKNFSGAEIGGLIKSATSFAFNRHVEVGAQAKISQNVDQMQIGRDDFEHALDEVKPAFGVAQEELEAVVENGIIEYDSTSTHILQTGSLYVQQVRQSDRTPLVSVLLRGDPGTGKTALAASIAQASDFPYIKLISPEGMVGFTEAQKIAQLSKVFADSYKSVMSIVVVDNIERLIDWVPIGPRFSNAVLQALLVAMSKRPPKGHRLLVLATTSNAQMLADMGVLETFSAELRVPPIDRLDALLAVTYQVGLFAKDDVPARLFERRMREAGLAAAQSFVIGIKKWLLLIEMAAQAGSTGDARRAEVLFERTLDTLSLSPSRVT